VAAQPSKNPGTGGTERVANFGMGKEKALSASHDSEASLLSLLLAGWSMALLNQVVLTFGG